MHIFNMSTTSKQGREGGGVCRCRRECNDVVDIDRMIIHDDTVIQIKDLLFFFYLIIIIIFFFWWGERGGGEIGTG